MKGIARSASCVLGVTSVAGQDLEGQGGQKAAVYEWMQPKASVHLC